MTFTGRSDDLQRLRGISYGITAPEQLRPVAEVLVIEMDGEPVFIAEEHRDLYHAALASAAAQEAALSKRVLFLSRSQKVFHLWHVVHKPFSYAFAVLALLHIGLQFFLGYF